VTVMHAVVVPVGADLYAVPIDWVRQVLVAPSITTLATAPSRVLGLFNLRGEIVPLLDTAALLGVGVIDPVAFAVVLRSSRGPVALAATGMPERLSMDGVPAPSTLPGTTGTWHVEGRVVVSIDPSALLAAAGLVGPGPGSPGVPVAA
jgi:purine-binding chemotaxis protein CheW